ncbi:exodeoxyribonuclease VIII-like protein [Pectobacterium aroidearum]|nr:exodeoxyribonuclease VIII-like protein [Pectobacterium aroidearum]
MTMETFIAAFHPKKSAQKNGAIPLATAVEAKNKKLAEMAAVMRLEETFPGASDNFFKPAITEDCVGSPRPAVGKFDETFLQENELVDGVWRRIEAPESQLHPDSIIDFPSLPPNERLATLIIYGGHEISAHDHSMVCDFLADDDKDPDHAVLFDALSQNTALQHMYPESVLELIHAINDKYPVPSDYPLRIVKFVNEWVSKPSDHPAPSQNIESSQVESQERERAYTHTHRTLSREVSLFLANDINDPWESTEEQRYAADAMMERDDEIFKRWSTELSLVEGALNIPRPVVHSLITEGKKRPELITDANARRQFVVDFLAEHMPSEIKVESMVAGRFSIDGLTGESASNQGEKTEVASAPDTETNKPEPVTPSEQTVTQAQASAATGEQVISDSAAQQAKEALDQLGYGVYATETDAPAPAPAPADDFQQRAEAIEAEIEKKTEGEQENLNIWKRVQRTDPRYTKPLAGAGFEGTSITSAYMFMRATEIFGPVGSGWGYRVLDEKMMPGAPLSEALYDDNKKFIGSKLLRDSDGSLISELNHSLKIEFWYLNDSGERSAIEAYGATPYMYKTKSGIKADPEVMKKSLTDAIKKALSLLGFSADVWLGMHDNPEYAVENAIEFQIKNASDRAEDTVRLRTELDEKLTKNAATLEKAVSVNEVNKVFGTIARELGVHLKDAEAKGDTEHAKYLSGRLRRLTQIKDERIAALNATEGEKA